METNIKLTIGAIITLALAISGTYYVADGETAYYCEAKDVVMVCEKLSSGLGTRCYFDETYKICSEGWLELEIGQIVEPDEVEIIIPSEVPGQTEGTKFLCSPNECVRVE